MEQIKTAIALLLVIAIVWWMVTRLTLPAAVRMVVEVCLGLAVIYCVLIFFGVHIPSLR